MYCNFFLCLESYETAFKKVGKAIEVSDLGSQNELSSTEQNTNEINPKCKKRRVMTTKLTKFASFELMEASDENETNNSSNKRLPEPPKLNGMFYE